MYIFFNIYSTQLQKTHFYTHSQLNIENNVNLNISLKEDYGCVYISQWDLSYSQLLEDNSDIVRTLKSTLVMYRIINRGVVFWD